MESNTEVEKSGQTREKGPHRIRFFITVILVAVFTSILTVWVLTFFLFPKQFKPVELSKSESRILAAKLERLDPAKRSETTAYSKGSEGLAPEKYSEDAASRHVVFTERELNALLAKNTDLAEKLAIDLSDDLASARIILPLDPDLPVLGGKTLKVSAGLELRYENARPVVMLRGISLWGVPLPNAWIGGIKNVDLVKEFGGESGFWKAFADGIEYIKVEDGRLTVQLKE
jgi:hypothetical protein